MNVLTQLLEDFDQFESDEERQEFDALFSDEDLNDNDSDYDLLEEIIDSL